MRKLNILSFFFIIFSSVSLAVVSAQEIELKGSVDKTEVDINDTFTLTIEVSGSYKETPKIHMPKLDDFKIVGTSSFNGTSINGKEISMTTKIIYMLRPNSAGTFAIEPAMIKSGLKTYKTEPIEIKVTGEAKQPEEQEPESEPEPYEDTEDEEEVTL